MNLSLLNCFFCEEATASNKAQKRSAFGCKILILQVALFFRRFFTLSKMKGSVTPNGWFWAIFCDTLACHSERSPAKIPLRLRLVLLGRCPKSSTSSGWHLRCRAGRSRNPTIGRIKHDGSCLESRKKSVLSCDRAKWKNREDEPHFSFSSLPRPPLAIMGVARGVGQICCRSCTLFVAFRGDNIPVNLTLSVLLSATAR